MAYFDSEKNKALWAKRLAVLEQERDRRKAEGYRPAERRSAERTAAPVKAGVRAITFDELVAKEAARHRAQRTVGAERQRRIQPAPAREAQANRAM